MKIYNGEKAIISLTSWKARINTVGLTIFSLIKNCPGFHIVLVLSEEEFPKKLDELPEDIKILVQTNKIEILWVYRNYKSFKKFVFTMDKYKNTPIISADDDCIYTCNYANALYSAWCKNKTSIITNDAKKYWYRNLRWCRGPNTLYPPNIFSKIISIINVLPSYSNDDAFFGALITKNNVNVIDLEKAKFYKFHDCTKPLSESYHYVQHLDIEKYKYLINEIHKIQESYG